MTNTKPVFHGSDIEKISEYYHIDQNSITNFAGNVNPLGLSPSVKEAVAAHVDLFSSYPDRDYKSLRNTIAEYCDVPADFILPGNGSSELISRSIPLFLDLPILNTPENFLSPEVHRTIIIFRKRKILN